MSRSLPLTHAPSHASFGERAGAEIIDTVITVVASFAVFFVAMFVGLGVLVEIASFALIPTIFGKLNHDGGSPGKRALGIVVVAADDPTRIASLGKCIGREFGKYISGFVLFIGYLHMLWDADNQTWHDKMAGTLIVPSARLQVSAHPAGPPEQSYHQPSTGSPTPPAPPAPAPAAPDLGTWGQPGKAFDKPQPPGSPPQQR